MPNSVLGQVRDRFRELRENAGITARQVEDSLKLGPGWVSQFESGSISPNMDLLFAMLHEIGSNAQELFQDVDSDGVATFTSEREIYAVQNGSDLKIHFKYADFDATYDLPNATLDEFDSVVQVMRDELVHLSGGNSNAVKAAKTNSIVKSFLKAVGIWPHVNPSDLWWFVIQRAYLDPYNHPAEFHRLSFEQSLKRTAGWALEVVLVQHYGPYLKSKNVLMYIADSAEKTKLAQSLKVAERLEPAKIDVVLVGVLPDGGRKCFGVVHVKASFAERRTDDVPMSQALVGAGYTSPLWTMDCKSTPSNQPANNGELGVALNKTGDNRSAKRKDIEDDGYFSACFAYNSNTIPTPESQNARASIYVCDFRDPDDAFSKFILSEWRRHSA